MNTADVCRPCLNIGDVIDFLETYTGNKVHDAGELEAYEDRNYCISLEENREIKNSHSFNRKFTKHIVKVIKYSEKVFRKWQSLKTIMAYLKENGFFCTQILALPNDRLEKNGAVFQPLILNYLKGEPLMKCWSKLNRTSVFRDTGQMVAQLHNTLENLEFSMLTEEMDHKDPWKLDNAICMLDYIDIIKDQAEKDIITSIIKSFVTTVEQVQTNLTKGIIHGDLHDMNLIVNCEDGHLQPLDSDSKDSQSVNNLFGIIDFGDMCVSCYIYEVAQVIRDFMVTTKSENCYSVAVYFLDGYLKHRKLHQSELDILFISIMTALCQYYVIGEYVFLRQPDNEYSRAGSKQASELIWTFHDSQQIFKSNLIKCLKEKCTDFIYSEEINTS